MKKIPVGQIITEAYRFTFTSLDRIIGVIWLPIILLTVGDYFVAGPYLTRMADAMEAGDAAQLGPIVASQIGYGLVQLVIIAIIGVSITREILAPLNRPLFLRFSLGVTELRLVAAIIGVYVLLVLVTFACVALGMMFGGVLSSAMPGVGAGQRAVGFGILLAVLLSPLLIYVFVRLVFLTVPAVVVENSFGLERSWQLAKGNIGRLILVSLAIAVPLLAVAIILQAIVLGPEGMNAQVSLLGDQAAQTHQSAEHMRQLAAHLPLLKGLEFVLAPFVYGLVFAAPAFTYKFLAAPETTA